MRNKIAAPLLVIAALLLVFAQIGFAQDMNQKKFQWIWTTSMSGSV